MDFKNASLEELKQFVKEHKIKGVSALRKPALIEFLEKNYSDEAGHAEEKQNVKSQKKDAEKIKKTGRTRKPKKAEPPEKAEQTEKTEHTEQPGNPSGLCRPASDSRHTFSVCQCRSGYPAC